MKVVTRWCQLTPVQEKFFPGEYYIVDNEAFSIRTHQFRWAVERFQMASPVAGFRTLEDAKTFVRAKGAS